MADDQAVNSVLAVMGLVPGQEPIDGANVIVPVTQVVQEWIRSLNAGQIDALLRVQSVDSLRVLDGQLVDAIRRLKESIPNVQGLETMMKSLYELQVKIILFRCNELRNIPPARSADPAPFDPSAVNQLIGALNNKFTALGRILQTKRDEQYPVEAAAVSGGGAMYKAKKYKYKYLRAKNGI